MANRLSIYRSLLIQSVVLQRHGDIDGEDRILATLDNLWLSMPADERRTADDFARLVGNEPSVEGRSFVSVETFDAPEGAPQSGTSSAATISLLTIGRRALREWEPSDVHNGMVARTRRVRLNELSEARCRFYAHV
jgi:hypothetical protein